MRSTLVFALMAALLVHAPARRDAADEREAQELAVRFMKRLRETDDFGPLVSEFFPRDFAGRLRAALRGQAPDDELFNLGDREVISRADDADLRRGYVALMNFWNQQDSLNGAALDGASLENRLATDDIVRDWEYTCKRAGHIAGEALPEEALRIADSDPALHYLFGLVRPLEEAEAGGATDAQGDDGANEQDKAKTRAIAVHDLARLRAVIEKLESCIPMLREAAKKVRAQNESLAAAHGVPVREERSGRGRDKFEVYKLESDTLESETFGLPAGEVLTEARVYPFTMLLARLDGRLTILLAYPDIDGD